MAARPVPRPPDAARRTYGAGPTIDGQAALDEALARLLLLDPETIGHLVAVAGPPPLRLRPPGFAGLAAIVTGQQLSTTSAGAIFARLAAAVDPLDPAGLLAAPIDMLRTLGLSNGKIGTLRAVAEAVAAGRLSLADAGRRPAEEAHAALVTIKGIGPWTADSFLLFCLGHPDAWPAGDLALQEAARVALRLDRRPSTAALHALGDRWRPLRGVAARLLWAYYRVIKQGRDGMLLATGPGDTP